MARDVRTRLTRIISGIHHVLWTFPDRIVVYSIAPGPWRALLPIQENKHPWSQDVGLPHLIQSVVEKTPAGRGDKWHIGLPLEYFTLVNFNLPQAAGENLDQAVKYALMRHVPFELSSTYTDYRVIGSNGQLEIAAVVAQKDMVDPVLQAFSQSGLAIRSMFPSLVFWALGSGDGAYLLHAQDQIEVVVLSQGQKVPFHLWFRPSAQEDEQTFAQRGATLLENIPEKPETLHVIGSDLSELPGLNLFQSVFSRTKHAETPPFVSVKTLTSAPYSLSFLSRAVKKQEKAFRSLRIGGLVFLLLSLFSFPVADLLGTMQYSDRLQTKVDAVQKQVRELETIRSENQELVQFFEVLTQKVQGQPQAASLLKELTEVMPETAWLYTFNFSDQRIRIQGEAESATAVLEALENSHLFENVQFDSPVQKSGSRARFKIMAKVVS